MITDRVIDSLGRIDDDMIQAVETLRRERKRPSWIKWGAIAACFCLIVASAYIIPRITDPNSSGVPIPNPDGTIQRGDEPDVYPNHPILRPGDEGYVSPNTEPTDIPHIPWTIHYNEATSVMSASRAYIKGYFTETLDAAELAALKPGMWFEPMTCAGQAGFDQDGNLLDVVMTVTTSMPENPVTISLADYYFGPCYELPGEGAVSVCNEVEYKAYQYEWDGTVTLAADAVINDVYFHFTMDTAQEQLEQAKADFKEVLECFAHYEAAKPDLSVISPEEIPELMEQIFDTLSEARVEPDFGRYLPTELPAGFGESAIRRFRFHDANYLSALWSKGLNDLTWVVSPYTEEDAHRLTSVEEEENYDLSLYPIPRARSVPDELREIVNDPIFAAEELTLDAVYRRAYKVDDTGDTDGWRMKFSVRYGDIVVAVSTKGVEPEWMYQQLTRLIEK